MMRVPPAVLALAVAAIRPAWAQKKPDNADMKMSKKEAGYVLRTKASAQTCSQCIFFIAPNDCSIVQGPVSELGWCKYYGD